VTDEVMRHVAAVVAAAPPLTEVQRAKLAALLAPTVESLRPARQRQIARAA